MSRSAAENLLLVPPGMKKGFFWLLTVVSALLVTASFPPFDLCVLAWFGLSPLLLVLRRSGSPVASAGLAFLFGCVFGTGAFYWANSISAISLSNFLAWLILFSLYFFVFGILYRLISARIGPWIVLGAPALWVAMEYARANLSFLSWPWNLLGHSQYRYLPVIQIADITGVYGISFLIVMVNEVLSQVPDLFARRRRLSGVAAGRTHCLNRRGPLVLVAFLLVLTFCYGWFRLARPESDKHLRVALVQPNVLAGDNMSLAEQRGHLQAYERLTTEAAKEGPDLIVWPASSLPAPMSSSRLVRKSVKRIAYETRSYLLVGGAGHEKLSPKKEGYVPYSNSEFLISPSGRVRGQYNKIQLVPFNEYVPLKGKITWPKWITTVTEDFLRGEEYTLFQVSGARFGTPICWENMFPSLFRHFVADGADFMVSVTNEGFFGPTAGPYQSLAINVFRAVENRVAVVRAATTGVSVFINPDGDIVERVRDNNGTDLFVSGVLVREVPLSSNKTFYTLYGDIFAWAVICMAALLIIVSLFPQRWTTFRFSSRDEF